MHSLCRVRNLFVDPIYFTINVICVTSHVLYIIFTCLTAPSHISMHALFACPNHGQGFLYYIWMQMQQIEFTIS